MTTMVRLLEREQLVHRQRDPDDGRADRIVLTAKARKFEPIAERTLIELGAPASSQRCQQRWAVARETLNAIAGERRLAPPSIATTSAWRPASPSFALR